VNQPAAAILFASRQLAIQHRLGSAPRDLRRGYWKVAMAPRILFRGIYVGPGSVPG
jgi:hypothetical protein